MSNALIVLVGIALLAFPFYMTFRGIAAAKKALAEIEAKGFNTTRQFRLGDTIIAVDPAAQKIALANLEFRVTPREWDVPVDRDGGFKSEVQHLDSMNQG